MVKKIVKDPLFLAQKSVDATEADKQVVTDLLDTLRDNLGHCVGMAANMIGVKKNIIVVAAGPFQFAMINPVITNKSGEYQTEEECLSLTGVRPCTRYQEIEVDKIYWRSVLCACVLILFLALSLIFYCIYNIIPSETILMGYPDYLSCVLFEC